MPYAAAKAGIQMLTQDLAAKLGPYNIWVNCIAPETILIKRNQECIPEVKKQALVEQHPIKRLGALEVWRGQRCSWPRIRQNGSLWLFWISAEVRL